MTTRSLFNIILKIFGIFVFKDILAATPQLLSVILYLTKLDTVGDAIWTFLTSALVILIYIYFSYTLIFKSDFIIDKLKLDKGFDQETIPLNIHRLTILSISIIVIGGLIIVDEVPNLCRQLFSYYHEKRITRGSTNPTISYSLLAGTKILIGLLLIGNQRQIVQFIEYKRKQ